jgi:nucleoside-diphosphate-sugar epimerase
MRVMLQAVRADPPFEFVIHTASPFHNNFDDPVKGLLEPAINGTTGILRAIKKFAPQVRRVVVTSSFAAMANPASPPKVYDETSWNPVTWNEAVTQRALAYRGSKVRIPPSSPRKYALIIVPQTFAEKAAWEFIEKEKQNFDIVTMNPPLVYGPIAHHLDSLENLNTSNQTIRDFIQGKTLGDELSPTGTFLFTDVRDLALAHVRAIEVPEAGGKRFFITAGHYSLKTLVEAIRASHPELTAKLPQNPIDDTPAEVYGYDNSRARRLLGIKFTSLDKCVGDTTSSLLQLGAKL